MTTYKVNHQQEREAFDTHYNYARCLETLINNSKLLNKIKLGKQNLPFLKTKENLIKLTMKSLKDEYKIVGIDKDYSYASTSWLPIKSYYLIFNKLLTIEYIIKAQKSVFSLGHSACIENFTKKLSNNEISFTNSILNKIFDKKIFTYHDVSGANLSKKISIDRRYKLAMKKIANYKFEEWRRIRKIENFRSQKNKDKKKQYLDRFKISIFEFPYYMRIRSNYRDFAFIEGISTSDTASYFVSYYAFTMGFYDRLTELEKILLTMRL